jgi:hypothetical protein
VCFLCGFFGWVFWVGFLLPTLGPGGPGGGGLVEDWAACVKSLAVSSRESWAYRLTDGSAASYWQSCGAQVRYHAVLGMRIRMFLGLQDPDRLVRGTDPDPSLLPKIKEPAGKL